MEQKKEHLSIREIHKKTQRKTDETIKDEMLKRLKKGNF